MEIGINNLIAQMQGRTLTIYQRADALSEFNKLVEHTEELEKQGKNNIPLSNVRLSLPSEEDIFNEATTHGKRLFDMDMDQEQLDLIQSSMRFMRDIIIELNNETQ